MSKDKIIISELIFAPNEGYCVNYPLNIFCNTRGFKNWGISLGYSPVLAGEYSALVTH